ncbi:MAG: ATP-binding cassette domain-containing protein [Pseudomonadota bacterium]
MRGPGFRLRGRLTIGGTPLIDELQLEFSPGSWTALLGPSGVGKSTIGRLVAGLNGAHAFDGAVSETPKRVAVMAQDGALLPWADALANVTVGAKLRGETPDKARALHLLEQVGLAGLSSRRPAALSGGQRQRVALARTLLEDSPLVVLDEPFSALDAATRLAMQDLAHRLLAGRTVVLITHDPLEAARLADQAYLLSPSGAEALALPDTAPPRAIEDPATLQMQAELFARLQGKTAA